VEATRAVEYHIIMVASIERKEKESMKDGVPFIWKRCFEMTAKWPLELRRQPGWRCGESARFVVRVKRYRVTTYDISNIAGCAPAPAPAPC
jgi:hypothetical protein